MQTYVILFRGINVGGKNKIAMADLRQCLEGLGFSNVVTYINSGNVILNSDKKPAEVQQLIEQLLPQKFKLDSDLIKVLAVSAQQLIEIVQNKPKEFGEHPDTYHSDTIFLMDIAVKDAMTAFSPRTGVDAVWPGNGVVYSQRVSAERTKSRLSKITESSYYKSMTIRSWNTTLKLLQLIEERSNAKQP